MFLLVDLEVVAVRRSLVFHKKPKKKGKTVEEETKPEEIGNMASQPEQPSHDPATYKRCSACNTFYARGDERCPNCGSSAVK